MGGRVEVHDGAEHQQRHGPVEEIERVGRMVEEQQASQSQHQAGHRHGQEAQHAQQGREPGLATRLFHQPGTGKDDQGPGHAGAAGQFQAVPVGQPAAAVHVVEVVVLQRQLQVVGPQLDQGCPHGHHDHHQDGRRNQGHRQQVDAITAPVGAGNVSFGAAAHGGALAALQPGIQGKGQQGRHQQQQADQGTASELLLADHGLVGFHGQHAVGAAGDLGHAEVGNGEREHQAQGTEDAVACGRQGDGGEDAPARCAHGMCCVVQAAIGLRQGRQQDHHGVWEGVEHFTQQDAPEAVDAAIHPLLEQALVAEQVDQRDARQERRCQQRQQADAAPQALEGNAGALQGVGKHIGQRYRHHGGDQRYPQAAPQHGQEIDVGKERHERLAARPVALGRQHGLRQDEQQRTTQAQQEQRQQQPFHRAGQP